MIYTLRHPIAQFISSIEACRDSVWNIKNVNTTMIGRKGIILKNQKVYINKAKFYESQKDFDNFYDKMEAMNFLPVYYHELCDNQEETLEFILNYLGLDYEELNTSFKKIRKWDILSRIKNPKVLSEIDLTGTRWGNIPII